MYVDRATVVTSLRSAHSLGQLGVPAEEPRLTWRVESTEPTATQLAFELQCSGDSGFETVVSSGRVPGAASIAVAAPGGRMASREVRLFRVRIETGSGWTAWGPTLRIEVGLGEASDWSASAVGIDSLAGGPAPLLRKDFELRDEPVFARLYVTSLGLNDIAINGRPVAPDYLAPGWTAYQHRLLVRTHDVTGLLRRGSNAIGAILGDGWYRGRLGWDGSEHYGDRLALIAQLEVTYSDGSTETVATDESWRGGFGEVRSAGIYDGADIDLTQRQPGWSSAGFDDSAWVKATTVPMDFAILTPAVAPPVREVARFEMTKQVRDGRVILDAGQNIAGWVRLVVRGKQGDAVTIRHAEILQPDGSLFTLPLRSARAADIYTLDAHGEAVLEPIFTFHGFRYAEYSGDATLVSATAIAISTDNARRATFAVSEPALEKLHSNVVWSQRGNFVSLPTDCPQRDERFGWTGDAQAFAATSNTLFETADFWQSWLTDLAEEQGPDGAVPSVVPNVLGPEAIKVAGRPVNVMGRAGWGDAATIVPWAVYESFGDTTVLAKQLPSMRNWVRYLRERLTDDGLLPIEFQWGDWLDPDADEPWAAKVSSEFVANAFLVNSARILARAEFLVGDATRAADCDALADRITDLVWARHGELAITTQTGCAIALEFRIAPEAERARIAAVLATNVRGAGGRIATGFLGTPLVLHALSHAGYVDEAYQLLLRREMPSWLYQVDVGATTLWERWDALNPDGTVSPANPDDPDSPDLLSFNHYAYGAVVDWIYRNVAGLAPTGDSPGYRTVVVAPRPFAGITWARAAIETSLGHLAIDWVLWPDGDLVIDLIVPFGATARLDLPVHQRSTVSIEGTTTPLTELGHGSHRIVVTP